MLSILSIRPPRFFDRRPQILRRCPGEAHRSSDLCFLIPRPVVSTVAIKRYSVLKCPHQSGPQSTSQSGENMKTRTILFTLLLCFVGAGVCLADDPMIGTWKLNEAKSKIGAGSPKNTTVIYEAAGDSVKVTTDGSDGDGKPSHSEWTGKYDGKDYPVTGDPNIDTRSYKKVNDHTLAFTNKKGDKVTISGRGVVSADGKTRTGTITGTDSKGKKYTATAVYDKQ